MIQALKSAAFRSGVEVMEVNPAYTSVMEAMNWATQKGMTPHQAAALAIARRGWGFSENPSVRTAKVVRGATHVTFDLPVWNRSKPVWVFWAACQRKLQAVRKAPIPSRTKPPAKSGSGTSPPV